MLTRSWALILGLAILGGAAGGVYAAVQRPVYQSTAEAFVSTTTSGESLADLSAGAGYLQTALKGYAKIATTSYVLTPVISGLKLDTTPAELAKHVDVAAGTDNALIDVTVSDSDPTRAKQIADAITAQLSQAVVDLTPAGTTAASGGAIKVTRVDPALVASSPTSPQPLLSILIGALAGIVLAVLIGLVRELLDTRVRSGEDLERVTETPLLGTTSRNVRGGQLVLRDAESSTQAEEYRTIRTNLRFVRLDAANRSIVVTSSNEREGKSTTAANLALAVARLGQRVLLVDADLRRPTLATLFGIDGSIGLSDLLIGDVDTTAAVQQVDGGRLDVLPAGAAPPNPNELLQSSAMDDLLVRLRDQYDLVIFDSPPLLAVSDAAVLSTRTSGAIVVAAARRARRGQVRQALEALDRVDARALGLILTMVPGKGGTAYGYGLQATPQTPRVNSVQQPARVDSRSLEGGGS